MGKRMSSFLKLCNRQEHLNFLSIFIKKYQPKNILCYADWNLFNGRGYTECNFKLTGYTGPDKFYITTDHKYTRIDRNPHRYKELMNLVQANKLWLCYGAGSLRFEWTSLSFN